MTKEIDEASVQRKPASSRTRKAFALSTHEPSQEPNEEFDQPNPYQEVYQAVYRAIAEELQEEGYVGVTLAGVCETHRKMQEGFPDRDVLGQAILGSLQVRLGSETTGNSGGSSNSGGSGS